MKKLVLFGAAIAFAAVSTVRAADEAAKKPAAPKMAAASAKMEMATPDDMKWGDAPPMLSPGAKLAVLEGNPSGTGYYTVALKVPDGYKIMPHWHPTDENVTVLSGTFAIGMGENFDAKTMTKLPAGGYALLPANMRHYAMASTAATVQVHGMGPFQLTYVNPADDPMKMKKP